MVAKYHYMFTLINVTALSFLQHNATLKPAQALREVIHIDVGQTVSCVPIVE